MTFLRRGCSDCAFKFFLTSIFFSECLLLFILCARNVRAEFAVMHRICRAMQLCMAAPATRTLCTAVTVHRCSNLAMCRSHWSWHFHGIGTSLL